MKCNVCKKYNIKNKNLTVSIEALGYASPNSTSGLT